MADAARLEDAAVEPATSQASAVKTAEASLHRPISSTEDLVAELQLDGAVEDRADADAEPAAVVAVSRPAPSGVQAGQAQLTPEQEAAVGKCVQEFVDLYEHAFLSRAVQHVVDVCAAQGLPESVVAAQLRPRGIDLAQLQAQAAEVQRGIAECASDEGWKLIQDGALRLLYRHSPGSTVHCFKGSTVLPAPLEQPLSMAREFDLVKTWNTYITHSPILKTFCDVDLLVYASVWLPWPFAERDVLISAVADDHLKDHAVVAVSFASPPDTPTDVQLPTGADQRVHIYFTQGSCMTLTPVAPPPETVNVRGGRIQPNASSSGRQHTKVHGVPHTVEPLQRVVCPGSGMLVQLHCLLQREHNAATTTMVQPHT